jgi:ribosomal peptide maturation radical SAM protein 1
MKVAFVNMPFGAIRPAIGVSLLKSHLAHMGVSSQILYLNMRFARKLGLGEYQYIAEQTPSQSLAGDWVFSRAAFGARVDADVLYLESFAHRFRRIPSTSRGMTTLVRARDMAEEFLGECLDQVEWGSYEVIGFTSTFTQNVASLALARRLKERFPRSVIVFGGANCEAEMGLQAHRSFDFIDFVCSGEADLSFPELIQNLMTGKDTCPIPGVISRLDGRSRCVSLAPQRVENLDSLPYPDYGDFFEQSSGISSSYKPILMESARGCWWGAKHHCTFCGLNGTSMAFRSKSASRVLEEVMDLCTRYESRFIEMVDNILDMHYFHDLLPELQKRRLQLGLFYETKANLSKEQVAALRDAGILSIQPGIESFSTDILRLMRKGTTAVQNVQLLKWCKELGVKPLWNIIYGFPGENPADYEATVRLMDSIHHLQPPFGFGAIRLDRFSPNFVSSAQLGICNVRSDRSYRYIYDLPDDDLFRLAYYFEHDYDDGRDPEDYTQDVRKAVRRWQAEPANQGLVYADHGELLAIWDFRSEAKKTLTVLKGYERAVYLYCDQNRSLQHVHTFLAADGCPTVEIEPFFERLINARLMVNLDSRYLSLAVRAGNVGTQKTPMATRPKPAEHVVL